MKLKWMVSSALAAIMALALSSALFAQSAAHYPPPTQQQQSGKPGAAPGQPAATPGQPPAAPAMAMKTGTFVGRVMRLKNGRYALITGKNGGGYAGHFLSGRGLKKYVGKQVRVKGNLNRSTNTVTVTSIHAA